MSNPTQNDQDDRPRWWLELDEGELLEVDGSTVNPSDGSDSRPSVTLRLPASRAHDLAHVLDTYTRMVGLLSESSEVSGTEESLAMALLDASLDARGETRSEGRPEPSKVTSAARLRAMAVLQAERPWLTHTALDRRRGRGGMVTGPGRGRAGIGAARRGGRGKRPAGWRGRRCWTSICLRGRVSSRRACLSSWRPLRGSVAARAGPL